MINETPTTDVFNFSTLSTEVDGIDPKNATVLAEAFGLKFLEHDIYGDEYPIVLFTSDGRLFNSNEYEIESAIDALHELDASNR